MEITPYKFTIQEKVTIEAFEGYVGRKPQTQEELTSFGAWVEDSANNLINWDEFYLQAADMFKEMD